ncbi:MAG: hypothetical protein QW165_02210 [Candidatus Woesearchaeota archaeon]
MKKSTILLVVLLIGAVVFATHRISASTTGAAGFNSHDFFAKCLTENGATFYGTYWCLHCQEQKRMFGASFEFVNYVECSLPNRAGQTEVCARAGIKAYPTWDIRNVRREGVLSFQQLSELTGCVLP